MTRILFANVKKGHAHLEQGHWFFHEGRWAVCASAGECENGKWEVQIHFEKWDNPLPEKNFWFATLDQAKIFVSEYFEAPVVDCKPSQFPKLNAL